MKNWQKRFEGVVLGVLLLIGTMAIAATTGTNIRDVAGLGTGVATALGRAANAASGVAILNGSGQFTKDTTGTAANASAVPVTGVTGLGTGIQTALAVAKNTPGGPVVTDSSNRIPALDGSLLTNVTGSGMAAGSTVTGTYTLALTDNNTQITYNGGAANITIPDQATVTWPSSPVPDIRIFIASATMPTIVAAPGVTMHCAASTGGACVGLERYGWIEIVRNASDEWTVSLSGANASSTGLQLASMVVSVSAASTPSVGDVLTIDTVSGVTNGTASFHTPAAGTSTVVTYAVPVGLAPSGTISDAAATVTLGTAFDSTLTYGAYLYMPLHSITATNAAGLYWFVGTSTTTGHFCNNTYDPATQNPIPPTSCTAFTDAVPGAYTATTGTSIEVARRSSISLGTTGLIDWNWAFRNNNSAGAKSYELLLATGGAVNSGSYTTSTEVVKFYRIQAAGSTHKQFILNGASGTMAAITSLAEDLSSPFNMSITLKVAVATDWAMIYMYSSEIK
jgi:hypothetical protein